MPKQKKTEHLSPFAVAIDTREQLPYSFEGMRADSDHNYLPLVVPTERHTIHQGDYSIVGHLGAVSVERKSLADLFGTIGGERGRFERELKRLASYRYAAVMVEAGWDDVLFSPPAYSELSPKIVFRSVITWSQRYQNIHWWFMPDRRLAEVTTYRILERFWKDLNTRSLCD